MLSSGSSFPFWLVRNRQKINKQLSLLLQQSRFVHNIGIDPSPLLKVIDEEKKHSDVGITEFLGSHCKLRANVKGSYEDFHVHEIDITGRIVRLTDLGPPPPPIIDNGSTKSNETRYIHCTLYKEGIGMAEAMNIISKQLRLHPNTFKWAGRKDKHGKTSQRISLSSVDVHHLMRFSSECKYIKLGNFVHSSKHLTLGQLRGNHFTLALKNVQLEDPSGGGSGGAESHSTYDAVHAAMEEAMNSLRDVGFINYFGLQRFGNFAATPNHVIGKAVLEMKWEEVFDLILTPTKTDSDDLAMAKKLWFSERDPAKIEEFLSRSKKRIRHRSVEVVQLLNGLARHYNGGSGDLAAAFRTIPKSVCNLYVPAFLSFLFNHVVTFRLQQFGLVPIPGDFVYEIPPFDDPSLCSSDVLNVKHEYTSSKLGWKWPTLKPLTEEDVASGQYSIHDVLLPVPGSKIQRYLNPQLQDFYEKLLHSQGLDVECFYQFKSNQRVPNGMYRSLVIRPQNVEFKLLSYNESDNLEKIIPSDLDLLNEDWECPDHRTCYQSTNDHEGTTSTVVKDKICAIIEFSLPSGSYATMALREILQSPSNLSTFVAE